MGIEFVVAAIGIYENDMKAKLMSDVSNVSGLLVMAFVVRNGEWLLAAADPRAALL